MTRMNGPQMVRTRLGVIIRGLSLAAALISGPAIAQQGDPEIGKRVWREVANCKDCHGWSGDGVPENAQREGANLRLSGIDPEGARETIRCGRPGTPMPSFRRNTWSEIIPCYGMTEPMEKEYRPATSETPLADRNIDGLVAYLFREIIDAGPVTFEYCEEYFGEGSTRCQEYPKQATLENGGVRD